MLTGLNIAVAAVAVGLMLLVLRGTLGHVVLRIIEDGSLHPKHWTPGDWMRFGVGVYHLKSLVRIVRWDLWAPMHRLLDDPDYSRTAYVAFWNIGFASAAIIGSLCVLYALWANIPQPERRRYSMLTAPWWPGRPPFFFGRLP